MSDPAPPSSAAGACAACAAILDSDARFCSSCGAAQQGSSAAAEVEGHVVVGRRPGPAGTLVLDVRHEATHEPREARSTPALGTAAASAASRREMLRADLLRAARHPALPPVHHAKAVEGGLVVVTGALPAGTLADRRRRGPLPAHALLRLLERIGGALQALVDAGAHVVSVPLAGVRLGDTGRDDDDCSRAVLADPDLDAIDTLESTRPVRTDRARRGTTQSQRAGAAARALARLGWELGPGRDESDAAADAERTVPGHASLEERLRVSLARWAAGHGGIASPAALVVAAQALERPGGPMDTLTRPLRELRAGARRSPLAFVAAAVAVMLLAVAVVGVLRSRGGAAETPAAPKPPQQAQAAGTPTDAPRVAPAQGSAESADALFARLREAPEDVDALRRLGVVHAAAQEPATAAGWFDAAVTAARLGSPTGSASEADLLCDAGVAHALLGDLARAEVQFEQALRRDPQHVQALANRAAFRLARGAGDAAAADARAALALDPASATAAGVLAAALGTAGRHDEAEAALESALAAGGDGPALRHALAGAARRRGDLARAAAHVQAAEALGASADSGREP